MHISMILDESLRMLVDHQLIKFTSIERSIGIQLLVKKQNVEVKVRSNPNQSTENKWRLAQWLNQPID